MNRPPSATRYTSTANRRPLLIEIALIAFVIAAIFVAALVGMSAALAADAAEQTIAGASSGGSPSSDTEVGTPPAVPVRT
jgi:hypothetical protein